MMFWKNWKNDDVLAIWIVIKNQSKYIYKTQGIWVGITYYRKVGR